jgi:peptidoglycan hydrolase CwlO-like protein
MAGNHVEQLESRVRELEATLDGLTDELVDTKDRVETLEAAIANDETSDHRSQSGIVDGELLGDDERNAGSDIAEDADQESESDAATDAESEETSRNAAEAGDTGTGEGSENEEIGDMDEMDGIIVA